MNARIPAIFFCCAMGWILITSAPAAEILAYYAFENDYTDASDNGNDAAQSQNPDELSFVENGFRGTSLSINDPDDAPNSGGSVDIPINANPSELPGVTFGGWVNVSDQFEFDGFMALDNGGWDRGITVNAQDSQAFGVASGEAPTHGGAITPGEWQYVVGTFDSAAGTATIYVGDATAATQTLGSESGQDLTDVGEPVIELGRYDNQDFHGLVDDIFVFDEALDAHRVSAIRNLRLSTLDYTPKQVAALFVFFDGGLTGVIDGLGWEPVSGLDAATPGAVADVGDGKFTVVLDDAGNGMRSGAANVDPDSDDDGLEDAWELAQFGNLDQTAEGDADEDGLTNLKEFEIGTLPTVDDTDGDGLVDGTEVNEHQTDPLDPDSDDDEASDGAEIAAGTDPNDSASVPQGPVPELLAYYGFEDSYADGSGKGNDATPSQNSDELSFVEDGFRGKSLSINDPDDAPNSGGSVDIPINANPSELPGVTFGGWVNVSDQFEFDGFMALDNGGWDRGITVNAQDSQAFGVASGEDPTHGGAITPGEWQYVVGTFDSEESIATVYVGDAMVSTQTLEAASGGDLTDVGEPVIEIGRYDNQDYNGLVDDVFVFDTALDAHRVAAIRNLRLSALDYSPQQVASLFVLFDGGLTGVINEVGWEPASGLDASTPGAVADIGDGNVSVVFDDAGNGMKSGAVDADPDSDDDGLEDIWETINFGNLEQTADGDPDGDGLTNMQEFERMTRPAVADSDRDGLSDGAEISEHMTDPLDIDSDDDGVSDGAELATGTDPNDPASLPRPTAPEVLAYYDFEGSYDDLSDNDNTARPEMNPGEAAFTEGFRGQGLDINDPDSEPNTGASVNIPVDVNPATQPEVSFGGWVNISDQFEFDGFMAIDNGGWDRGITVNAQESNSFGIASGAAPVHVGEITPDEWQFVVGTFSSSDNRSTLYVGSSDPDVQTTETADTGDSTAEGELEIEIGRYDNQDLDGVVDDVFVFAGALTDHQANAMRNLRLSVHDYSPLQAAQLFELFSAEASGTVGEFSWTPVSGLDPDFPGAVRSAGAGFTVVLDNSGNGMMSSPGQPFVIKSVTRDGPSSVTITWDTESDVFYAVEVSGDLVNWEILAEGLLPSEALLSHTDTSDEIATQTERYYRVREQAPPPLFSDGFEEGAGDWVVGVVVDFSETGTTWEAGPPSDNGPNAAFSGQNVFATDLDANYEDGTGIYLRSPVIDLTGAGRAKLTFQHYIIASDGEGGRLNILDADGSLLVGGLKLYVGPEGNTTDWTKQSIRLPDLNAPVIIEFEFLSGADDDPANRAGWFIDDVEVD